MYLLPYGSTQPENIETISDDLTALNDALRAEGRLFITVEEGPFFIFYDQEPIYGKFNYKLFDHIRNRYMGPFVLVTTEKNNPELQAISERYGWPIVYYFHHAFAAHDWFRGCRYDPRIVPVGERTLDRKYITFNRLTSSGRVYRSLLISELIKRGILDQGYVSYNDTCPDGGTYQENLAQAVADGLIAQAVADQAVANISTAPLPLRVDYQDHAVIPNHSFMLSAVEQTQQSFCYLVTETCYWETKCHLTEKIFKPIVSQMPFVLAGPAHNLKYLREYGFKTFDQWIDESYDDIEDPIERMTAIGHTMETICNKSLEELTEMLREMEPVLRHNYDRFYGHEFLDQCWRELTINLSQSVAPKN
jgi:hypothetical protein